MLTPIRGLPRVTDDELEALGHLNPAWKFERDDDGRVSMSPTHTDGGARSAEALRQLALWRDRTGAGGKVFDSSTGFRMSTGAVRSPDASWLSQAGIDALPADERRGFWRVCPDVVVEIASASDDWDLVKAKLEMYRNEGAIYAVAIDPFARSVVVLGGPPRDLRLDAEAIMDA